MRAFQFRRRTSALPTPSLASDSASVADDHRHRDPAELGRRDEMREDDRRADRRDLGGEPRQGRPAQALERLSP